MSFHLSKRSVVAIALWLACLLPVIGLIEVNNLKPKMPVLGPPVEAFLSLRVTIGENDQKNLVMQLNKFANANGFIEYVSQVRPDERYIVIELQRKDINITVLDPFEPDEFRIYFYKNGSEPIAQATIDALVESLKSFVPGVEDNPGGRG